MRRSPVWAIARWEFFRFAKARDLIVGALIFAVMFGGGSKFGEFVGGKANDVREIAVVGGDASFLGDGLELGRFRLVSHASAAADTLLANDELDAILAQSAPGLWEIRARRARTWFPQLEVTFGALLAQQEILALGLEPEQQRRLLNPAAFETVIVDDTVERDDGRTDAFTAGIALAVMGMGLFVGFSYVFVAITGEKTQRTTESILSAVTPQQWIDGKILGLTGAVLANLISTAAGYTLWQVLDATFFGGSMAMPGNAAPLDVVGLVAFSVAGFAFWFTLFALVAATIDDPNTSSRSSLMFLPMLLMAPAFLGLDTPDAGWMRALSWIPGPSAAAMPVRLLRSGPPLVEVVASLGLLVAGAWAFRRAAGRIFGTSMLMTGKEPGLREVLRWLREA